jgi:hypothetical protein
MYPSSFAPSLLARDLVQRPAALLLPLISGIAIGIAIACLAGQPPWGDQALYLVAAGKALDGARFGRDIVDVNPPLILWLTEIPVALARALDILPQTAMQALLGLMTAGILVWCLNLLRRPGLSLQPGLLECGMAALILYATTIHPWYHLGTREHILLVFLLPYLILAWRRVTGLPNVKLAQALGAGLLAIAGCGLKPQHLLVVIAVEALVLLRTGGLHLALRPEAVAIVAGGLAYCASIVILAPQYLTQVVPFAADAYLDRAAVGWVELIDPLRALKIAGVILAWLALRRWSKHRALAEIFIVAGIGAALAYVMQRKAYEYQFVPAQAFFILAIGTTLLGILIRRFGHWLSPGAVPTTVFSLLIGALLAGWLTYPGQVHRAATQWTDVRKSARASIVPHIPRGTTIFVLSSSVGGVYDHMLRQGLEWGSRFTALWMTQALLTRELKTPRDKALAHWTLDAVTEDLKHYRPSLILVDRCNDPAFPPCLELGGHRGDLLEWFRHDPSFERQWSRYEFWRQVGPYDLWCASDDPLACQSVVASLKPEAEGRALAETPPEAQ